MLKWQLGHSRRQKIELYRNKVYGELGIKVGDTSYLQSMGFDTSYLDRYNDLTLQEKQASLLKKKASGRSSGGYNPIDEELDEKINGTPGNSKVTTTRKQGTCDRIWQSKPISNFNSK